MTDHRWQKVEELFESALAHDSADRTIFLDNACAGDSALRQEVESLLAADAEAKDFIEPAVRASRSGKRSMAGRSIGPYQVIRQIGDGGMGSVYLAVRADHQYQKRVAIKLIKQGLGAESIIRRFRNERQILAALDHPNIPRLLDGGTADDGLPYFVMEYIEGKSIVEYCDSGRCNISRRLRLFRDVCLAVHYAHQNLVVHRDLKPSNILVTSEGIPKLLDFGIAKLLNPELGSQTLSPTPAPLMVMTPDYASPEQIRGEQITTASDVYSLGVVLYELLTGRQPFNSAGCLPHEICRLICEQEPDPPSIALNRVAPSSVEGQPFEVDIETITAARDEKAAKLRDRLTGDLDSIVLKAIKKEPSHRYASVEQLSEDIRRFLEGRPVSARKQTLAYRAGKFVKRQKSMVAAFALVLVALLLGLFVTARQASALREQLATIEAEKGQAERRQNLLRRLSDLLVLHTRQADGSDPRETVRTTFEILDNLDREALGDVMVQHQLAVAFFAIGESYSRWAFASRAPDARDGTYWDAARTAYKRCLELSQNLQSRGVTMTGELANADAIEKRIAYCDSRLAIVDGTGSRK